MQKIGIFDSGVGGLTVLKSLLELLPNEKYIYIGDNKNAPYGSKSKEELLAYVTKIVECFIKNNVSIIVVACNTVSSNILDILIKKYQNIVFFDVLEPTVKEVLKQNPKELLIIATEATINSKLYDKLIKEKNNKMKITNLKTPLLVPLIEKKDPKIEKVINSYLKPYKNIGTILLGCTHYKLVEKYIKKTHNYKIIASSDFVSREVYHYLKNKKDFSDEGSLDIFTTGNVYDFYQISKKIIKHKVDYLNLD